MPTAEVAPTAGAPLNRTENRVAKSPTRKLKVFQAQFGFHDTIVAAPSRAAALRAWGTHQDLFASGQATVVEDADAIAAAVAHPETPLKRAVGSKDAFALEAASLPQVPKAPKRPAKTAPAKAKAATLAEPTAPPADRSRLTAAETSLKALDEQRKREEAGFREQVAALEAAQAAAQAAYVADRKSVTASVVDARTAYRKAGGDD